MRGSAGGLAVNLAPEQGPAAFTSVQHLETTLCRFECQTKCQRLLHARFETERHAIFDALAYTDDEDLYSRALKICRCCRFPVIYVRDDGTPSAHLARCRDRLCPLCSSARARESALRIGGIVQRMDAPRFMTLTMPHSSQALDVQLRHLMDTFRDLRSESEWKHYVRGGVWSLELTYNKERSEWHPHIHIIFDGLYFPQPALKALWSMKHGENVIVDVRAVSSSRVAASYIAKYVSKVVDLEQWSDKEIREYATAMYRRRTVHTFGNCHGIAAEADTEDAAPSTSTKTVGVWVIRRRMRLGDEEATKAARALASSRGVLGLLLYDDVQHLVPLVGEQLRQALLETATWLRDLDPEEAAKWKPPRKSVGNPKPKPVPDRSLTEPPWGIRDAARL